MPFAVGGRILHDCGCLQAARMGQVPSCRLHLSLHHQKLAALTMLGSFTGLGRCIFRTEFSEKYRNVKSKELSAVHDL